MAESGGEGAKERAATDGSNKKGVQPNDQGMGQHLDRLFHAESPTMWLDARAKMLKIFNSLKLLYITPTDPLLSYLFRGAAAANLRQRTRVNLLRYKFKLTSADRPLKAGQIR